MGTFEGKVVIITGAGSGIGRSTAIAFANEGAKVVVSDINQKEGLETTNIISKNNGQSIFVKCDVSNEEDVKNMVNQTLKFFGKLDYAYNNAGVEGINASISDDTSINWDKIININLKGVWLCMKYEIPAMIKNGKGAIVNCSSIAGLVGIPSFGAYVASKHGVIGLTETACLEFGKNNIRINAICPGAIKTPMLDRSPQNIVEGIKNSDPMGRIGRPEEVADAVLWLCSEKSSYINGQSLAIDGGWVVQ